MNLLVLSTWYPYPPDNGSRLRAYHLLKGLHERGHKVRLVAGKQSDITSETVPAPLAALCETVQAVPWQWHKGGVGAKSTLRSIFSAVPLSVLETSNPELKSIIAEELARKPDEVLVLELGMDAYLPDDFDFLATPMLLDQAEVSGLSRALENAASLPARVRAYFTRAKAREYWHKRFARYRTITAVSDEEVQAVRAFAGRSNSWIRTLPNGVDVSAYPVRDLSRVLPGCLLYNGSPTYGPNRDAVLWFAREILPRVCATPPAFLRVTGRYSGEDTELRSLAGVAFTGFLPEMQTALAEAEVCVVPLRAGGGTRLKILEAWAAGVPVVSTTIGAAGLGAKHGEQLLLADTPDDFAQAVSTLLANPAQAQELSHNARQYVLRFDWRTIGERLDNLLHEVIRAPSFHL